MEDIPGTSEAGASKVNLLQPKADLQSNWEVDLAKSLEEYLLKICSGEISPDADPEQIHHSVNFAEAALLLQGSVQVYSRKVEYLYSLVVHALEFLSQKRQDQQEKQSTEDNGGGESNTVPDEENEVFLGLDDVPVEAKNSLDSGHNKDDTSNNFVKPPANLLVLEGDCLDTSGDAGELESYLLATCDFYGDFLLLDPCDAGAVYDFLKTNALGKDKIATPRDSAIKSKAQNSVFRSPIRMSGGIAQKSCLGKAQDVNFSQAPEINCSFDINNDLHEDHTYPDDGNGLDAGYLSARDDSGDDNDDPWKPLNPHEPGNLEVKPFRRGKFRKQVFHNTKQNTLPQFPLATLDGFISRELAESFKAQLQFQERTHASQSPPLYEKLRRSMDFGTQETAADHGGFGSASDDDGGDNDISDFPQPEFDVPPNINDIDTDIPLPQWKQRDDDPPNFDGPEPLSQDDPDIGASLEDLCRSHLDAILANIAETEKQTEMAARVSTWKQRIEYNLEEQDRHPSFDIHQYGERILDKLSLEAGTGEPMSFTNVVTGQPKHDIARTFSALLQLVNNGNVELQRPPSRDELICYTGVNPFHVRLLRHKKRRDDAFGRSPKKRAKTPMRKGQGEANRPAPEINSPAKSSPQNGRISVKLKKSNAIRCTPEGKRKRKSGVSGSVNLHLAD